MTKKLANVYRVFVRRDGDVDIWIVDGATVRREFYTDFVMGGHAARYKFIPTSEIWIDNSLSLEEFEYTLAHEALERKLMFDDRMTYGDAHDKASELEKEMRAKDRAKCAEKEENEPAVELGVYNRYGEEE